MLRRRLWLKTVVSSALAWFSTSALYAQQGAQFNRAERPTSGRITPLREQLTKGLRVVTQEQAQFVNVVVAFVDQGRIPRAMVNLVYRWSLERHSRVPFPYFEYALRVLAKRRGVNLP